MPSATNRGDGPGFTKGPWEARCQPWATGHMWTVGRPETGSTHTLVRVYQPFGGQKGVNEANARLIAAAPELYEALIEARRVIQEERDNMVDCATMPPEHDLATLDPMTKPYVEEYDAVLNKIDAALALARGEVTHEPR